jgi:protein SCO1/2
MDKRIIWVGLISLSLVAILIFLVAFFGKSVSFKGTSYGEPYPKAAQIELKKSNGEMFRLSDQKGKIVLLFFGFTYCTDVCPTTLANLKQALNTLGEDKAKSVEVVFVSVDPERDTPDVIQQYVERFDKSYIGLSGSMADLQKVWDGYGIYREKVPSDSPTDYEIEHTARVFLIDGSGNLRLSYGTDNLTEQVSNDLNILLKN